MTDRTRTTDNDPTCTAARKWIHGVLDGDLMDAAERQALDRHLAGCADCRELRRELEQIQSALRVLPELPLPDDALDEVWVRTSRGGRGSRLARRGLTWRVAAAAAVLAAALWSVWPTTTHEATVDQVAVDQAAAEARMVILLTAKALSRTQRVAIREGITEGVSPALRRVPMKMPATHDQHDQKDL